MLKFVLYSVISFLLGFHQLCIQDTGGHFIQRFKFCFFGRFLRFMQDQNHFEKVTSPGFSSSFSVEFRLVLKLQKKWKTWHTDDHGRGSMIRKTKVWVKHTQRTCFRERVSLMWLQIFKITFEIVKIAQIFTILNGQPNSKKKHLKNHKFLYVCHFLEKMSVGGKWLPLLDFLRLLACQLRWAVVLSLCFGFSRATVAVCSLVEKKVATIFL